MGKAIAAALATDGGPTEVDVHDPRCLRDDTKMVVEEPATLRKPQKCVAPGVSRLCRLACGRATTSDCIGSLNPGTGTSSRHDKPRAH